MDRWLNSGSLKRKFTDLQTEEHARNERPSPSISVSVGLSESASLPPTSTCQQASTSSNSVSKTLNCGKKSEQV